MLSPSRFVVQFKDSGVKKLLLLALVEDVDECYENLQALLQLLDLQAVSFVCAVDMKLANTVLGLQTCSSTHPCPWREMHRVQLPLLDLLDNTLVTTYFHQWSCTSCWAL